MRGGEEWVVMGVRGWVCWVGGSGWAVGRCRVVVWFGWLKSEGFRLLVVLLLPWAALVRSVYVVGLRGGVSSQSGLDAVYGEYLVMVLIRRSSRVQGGLSSIDAGSVRWGSSGLLNSVASCPCHCIPQFCWVRSGSLAP